MVSTDEHKVFVCSPAENEPDQCDSLSSSSSAITGRSFRRESLDGKKKAFFLLRNKSNVKPADDDSVLASRFRRGLRGLSSDDIVSARVLKRHKKDKWKDAFIVLKELNGPQLVVYDDFSLMKPKVVMELCYCFLYKIDESIAHHSNCILITSNGGDMCLSVYLAFRSFVEYIQWFGMLRRYCFGFRRPSPFTIIPANHSALNTISFVYLTICDYRGTSLSPEYDYSTSVLINGVCIAQTIPVSPAAKNYVSFNAHFLIENVPNGFCNLQLQLISYRQKRIGVSSAVFPLYPNERESQVGMQSRCDGFVFKGTLHRVVVLPEQNYAHFFKLLTSRSFLLCIWTGSVLDTFNCRCFVKHLLTLFLPTQSTFLSFIDIVLQSQLQSESSETLFRLDTFCSTCISTALRIVGRDAVMYELSPLLQQLRSDKPTAVDVESFVSALHKLATHLPRLLGAVLNRVVIAVRKHFPNDLSCPKRAVSCFFILRFLNPMLTFWDITGGPARELAKAVQEATNQACSAKFDSRSSSRAAFLMSQIIDGFMRIDFETEEPETSLVAYDKEEHFAMVAYEISRVVEENSGCCPVPETVPILESLRNSY
uniref:PH domain-containing protein n=1 Tax=Syphacia muris TaxID=451379 RepID=A0A0N5AFN2_9BILA